MAITPNTLMLSEQDYNNLLYKYLKVLEGEIPFVYIDDLGIPTLGVGYALVVKGADGIWALRQNYESELLAAVPSLTQVQLDDLDGKLTDAMNVLNGDASATNPFSPYYPESQRQNVLDWTIDSTQSRNLFDNIVTEYKTRVRNWLGNDALYTSLQGSLEMVALFSMSYNGLINVGNSKGLKAAILNGDRAEAWYEIRYNSGTDARRFLEGDTFGLFNPGVNPADPGTMYDNDALSAYRTFTRHRDTIIAFENNNVDHFNIAVENGNILKIPVYAFPTILNGAYDYLRSHYGLGTKIDAIRVGENDGSIDTSGFGPQDDSNTLYYRGTDNDALTGTVENDLFFGESGNDVLRGSGGNNVFYGGTGVDVYNIQSDTADYIIDSDGKGLIVSGDNNDPAVLSVAVRNASADGSYFGNWTSRDGNTTYSWSGADGDPLTIVNDIQTVTINNYKKHDLNLHLIDLPADPTNPDKAPVWDAVAHVQRNGTATDDSLFPATGRVDLDGDGSLDSGVIQGSELAETINGGDGNDDIFGGGGGDRLYGDAGDDFIIAGDSTISPYVSGGMGADVVIGGNGNDHLIGGLDDGTDDKSNFLQGYVGDDYLEAGSKGDVLAGGGGSDLLVGGAGNDYLLGSATILPNYMYLVDEYLIGFTPNKNEFPRTWSISPAIPELLTPTVTGNTYTFSSLTTENIDRVFDTGDMASDVMYGGGGSDYLRGGAGNDYLDGGTEADFLWAQGGDDVIFGGQGNDWLLGGDGNDILYGGENDDHLFGDSASGYQGNDILYGGSGNDFLAGGDGNDILIGGSDTDALYGGRGNDTYIIDANWGYDIINEEEGFDTIQFGAGILSTDISVVRDTNGNDLGLTDSKDNWIRIKNWYSDVSTARIEKILFADGRTWDKTDLANAPLRQFGSAGNDILIAYANENNRLDGEMGNDQLIGANLNDILNGGEGNDTLAGNGGNDILNGGIGNDRLDGGSGNNTYVFNDNWGFDVIVEQGGTDTIQFGNGISASDITVVRQNDALTLADKKGNSILIQDWYSNSPAARIEEVRFIDGTVWSEADLNEAARHQTGSDRNDALTGFTNDVNYLNGGLGNDRLIGANLNDVLDGGAGNDTLSGGGGDDLLMGGTGSDTYLIGIELGNTILRETVDGSVNTVQLTNGTRLSNITSSRSGDDLLLSWNGAAGSVTLEAYFNHPEVWQFKSEIGVSIPNDSMINPAGSDGSILSAELQSYADKVETELSAHLHALEPVTGTVTVSPVLGVSRVSFYPYVENGQVQYELMYEGGVGSDTFVFSDPMSRNEDKVIVNEIQGTDGYDWIRPSNEIASKYYNKDVYVSLYSGFISGSINSTAYVAKIVNSSYTRPHYLNDSELLLSGEMYNNTLRAEVGVYSTTYQYTIINAGAGSDAVGYQIPDWIYEPFNSYGYNYSRTRFNIDGGEGDDALFGGASGDFLSGGVGNDYLYGYGGDDVLVGGQGSNVLQGHSGADRYIIDFTQQSDDLVIDNGLFTSYDVVGYLMELRGLTQAQAIEQLRSADELYITQLQAEIQADTSTNLFNLVSDTVRINANFSDVRLNWVAPDKDGNLGIQIRSLTNPDASVTILTRGPNDFYGYGIENYVFADGNLTQSQLISHLPAIPTVWPFVGTPGDDYISGTDNADLFVGMAGADYIVGGDGNDVYSFNAGDSSVNGDEIYDFSNNTGQSGTDTLSFGLGIRPEDIKASLVLIDNGNGSSSTYLDLEFDGSGTNYLWISWDTAYQDGSHENSVIEYAQFITTSSGLVLNLAEIVNTRYSELVAADQQGIYIPLFTPEVLAAFDVTATVGLAGGEAAYNYATTGDIYTAPTNINTPPLLNNPILDQSAYQATAFTYTIPADTFTDADIRDTLTFTTAQSNGAALPAWLQFDAATRTFSGTPANGDVGNFSVVVTATDNSGASASNTFGFFVNNVNDAPLMVSVIDPQVASEGANFSLDVAAHFSDVDTIYGDQLNYTLTQADGSALPTWLSVNNTTGTLTGTTAVDSHLIGSSGDDLITDTDNGIAATYALHATATDAAGVSASTDFQVTLQGVAGNDVLEGLGGNDTLRSGAGNDTLIGGTGNDTLYGGAGNDTYIFNAGDGTDVIYDTNTNGDVNTVVFGAGVNPADITLSLGSLLVNYGNGDALHIADFDPDNAYQSQSITNFQFADGTLLSYADLINKGFDLTGSSGNDVITGTNAVDRITGGAGDDVLNGGAGSDTYYYNLGDGVDTIVDNAGVNTVVFGAGINVNNTIIRTQNGIAQLRLLDANGNETTQGFDVAFNADGTSPIQRFQFADGSSSTLADLAITSKIWYGTASSDTITAGRDDDTIYAVAGNDTVYGMSGNDTLVGGTGYDRLYGGDGNDTFIVTGTDAAYDTFNGGNGVDTLLGGAGDDTIRFYNYSGADTVEVIDGGTGVNVIAGTSSSDTIDLSTTTVRNIASIDAGAGNDTVIGTSNDDAIIGGAGYDRLNGGIGNDTFLINGADTAYDTFTGGEGVDTILGGAGDDTIRLYNYSGADTVEVIDGGAGVNVIAGTSSSDTIDLSTTTVRNIASIDAGAGNDTVIGTSNDDTIIGGAGYDRLNGGVGNDTFLISGTDAAYDTFNGGNGVDTILGGAGDDTIRLYNYSGADTVEVIDGGAGVNVIAGTSSSDTIDLSATTVRNIASIDAGAGNDTVTGTSNDDVIIGGAGYDRLYGGLGNDTFLINGTDTAYDTFNGGDGIDTILGGAGDDTIRLYNYSGADTVEVIDGGAGVNVIAGTSSSDTIDLSTTTVSNIAMIDAGAGNDTVTGTSNDDVIIGGAGYDRLYGGLGNDTFLINGTDSAYDAFNGGLGVDSILGGAGDDTIRFYNYSGADTVEVIDGGAGVNVIAGTSSSDTLDLSSTAVSNIAMIDAGAGNDTVTGTSNDDIILGGAGYDRLNGGLGNDTFLINGTDSAYDSFNGGDGLDTILGGAGDDTIRFYNYSGVNTIEVIDGGAGVNIIAGTSSSDMIDLSTTTVSNIAMIDAGAGNDTVMGTGNDDTILGGAGYDRLTGGAGNDVLVGGSNNDTLVTGNGTDTVMFNRTDGWDTLTRDTSISAATGAIVKFAQNISSHDLWLERTGNDLAVHINGSTEGMTVQGWYNSPQLVGDFKDGNGADLSGTQVEQLITAMAQFSQTTGLTWSQAIQQRLDEVNQILAVHWQAA
jgi:Ca2+-binding RTX toxin-like protein